MKIKKKTTRRGNKPRSMYRENEIEIELLVTVSGTATGNGLEDLAIDLDGNDISHLLDADQKESIAEDLYQDAVDEAEHQFEAAMDDKADRDMRERRYRE